MKTAWVIGATGGIGSAICHALSPDTKILAQGRSFRRLGDLASRLSNVTPVASGLDADSLHEVAGKISNLDWLVLSVGCVEPTPTEKLTVEAWDAVINSNLTSVAFAFKGALKHLLKSSDPRVFVIGSIAGITGFEQEAAYCAAKWGVRGLAASLRAEFPQFQICVLNLGATDTNLWDTMHIEVDRAKMLKPREVADKVRDLLLSSQMPEELTFEPLGGPF